MALTKNTNKTKNIKDQCKWCMEKAVFETDLSWYNCRGFPRSETWFFVRAMRHCGRHGEGSEVLVTASLWSQLLAHILLDGIHPLSFLPLAI